MDYMLDPHLGISVVIPLYNKAPYITATLASIESQISPASEIIVVDDGSTDGGAELISSRFRDVTLIRQTNGGEGAARNTGVRAAQFEWVAFLDADDLWLPNHLLELRNLISAFKDAHLVATSYVQCDGTTLKRNRITFRKRRRRVDLLRETRRNLGAFWTSALAVRRASFLSAGGFSDIDYGADVEAWVRLALHHTCALSTEVTAIYMTGNPGVMKKYALAFGSAETERPLIQSVADLPGVDTVQQYAKMGLTDVSRRELRRYVNGRLTQALRIAVRQGHQKQAAILLKFFRCPIGLRSLPYIGIALMPTKIRERLVTLWIQMKTHRIGGLDRHD